MRNYEIMFIVKPTLSEDEVKKVADECAKIITDNGGKLTKQDNLGQRELAYEINDFKSGYYFLLNQKMIKQLKNLTVYHVSTKILSVI